MMVILVTSDNYLLMFVGWEGMSLCLKWEIKSNLIIDSELLENGLLLIPFCFSSNFYSRAVIKKMSNLKSIKSIGRRYSNKLSPTYKKEYVLSSEQQEIIVGIILGDGYLERLKPTHNTRLRVEQIYPSQDAFVQNMYTSLKDIVKMSPSVLTRNDKRTGLTTQYIFFWTMTMPCLNYYYDLFYVNKIKIIPENIKECLTRIGLAYWLMGDGIRVKGKGVVLCTDSYTKEHVDLLVNVLNTKFGLTCTIQQHRANQFRIYIVKSSVEKLRDIVKPFIIPTMLYKIGLLPPNTPVPTSRFGVSNKDMYRNYMYRNTFNLSANSGNGLLLNKNKRISINQIICPKWLIESDNSILNFMLLIHTCNQRRFFFSKKLNSSQRIGPHNINVISLIVGSLLNNSYIEKRGYGFRIIFIKHNDNVEYLMWFHSALFNAGYCNNKKPKLFKLIGKHNKVFFIYSFKSYSFSSFNWLYEMFYRENIKIIPRNLDKCLTPLALSTLFLSAERPEKRGVKLSKSCVLVEDLQYISLVLKEKYDIKTFIKDSNLNGCKYSSLSLHINNQSVSTFYKTIKPHLLCSQYHLLKRPVLKLTFHGSNGVYNDSYISKRDFSSKKDFSDIKYTLKYKKEFVLSLEQKEAIIGIILGDGFLDRVKPNHNTRLRI